MDKFDQQIIRCLSENARQSTTEVARQIGLSRSAVTDRIRKLEDSGVIEGYRVVLKAPENLVSAFFLLTFNKANNDEVLSQIQGLPEVRGVHIITGDIDMIVRVEADNMSRLNEVRNHLEGLAKLTRIFTCTVLEERLNR